eukprot:SAG31_NODE_41094_length_277_cov_1.741573_1_plen_77_part_10
MIDQLLERLMHCPCVVDRHQAVIFALSSEDPQDATLRRSAPIMYLASVVMVTMQCLILARLSFSNLVMPCLHSDQCR